MTLPAQISVSFDFTSGATFGYPFTIGDEKYGVLGTGTLASTTTPEPTVDLTPNVRQISIKRVGISCATLTSLGLQLSES
jgi:hypothetical protein